MSDEDESDEEDDDEESEAEATEESEPAMATPCRPFAPLPEGFTQNAHQVGSG